MIDKKYVDILPALKELPPIEVFSQNPSKETSQLFIHDRYINSLILSRLAAFFNDDIEPFEPTPELKAIIRAVSAWRLAQYTLLFEVWDWFKPLAIKQRLLPANAKRSDCIRSIYEQHWDLIYRKKTVSNHTLYDHIRKDIKNNHDDMHLQNPTPIDALRLQESRLLRDAVTPALEALLYETAQIVGERDGVVKNARIAAINALEEAQKEAVKYYHHKNKTR
jgi:hypothetical protein